MRKRAFRKKLFFKTKWQLSLDMIDQVRAWGLPNRIVVADAGLGDTKEFRDELEARQLSYVPGVFPQRREYGAETTTSKSSTLPGARRSAATRYAYEETTADLRAGRGGPSERLEENPLAARHKGDGWNHDSWPYEFSPLMASSVDNHRIRKCGY